MVLFLIVFNVVFIATFVCLIKPSLLSDRIGGEPWSRWIFLVLLFVLVYIKQKIVPITPEKNMTSAQMLNCDQTQSPTSNCKMKLSLSSQTNASDEIPTAPAATIDVEDNNAAESPINSYSETDAPLTQNTY